VFWRTRTSHRTINSCRPRQAATVDNAKSQSGWQLLWVTCLDDCMRQRIHLERHNTCYFRTPQHARRPNGQAQAVVRTFATVAFSAPRCTPPSPAAKHLTTKIIGRCRWQRARCVCVGRFRTAGVYTDGSCCSLHDEFFHYSSSAPNVCSSIQPDSLGRVLSREVSTVRGFRLVQMRW